METTSLNIMFKEREREEKRAQYAALGNELKVMDREISEYRLGKVRIPGEVNNRSGACE